MFIEEVEGGVGCRLGGGGVGGFRNDVLLKAAYWMNLPSLKIQGW